jgi:hypothetical protein
VTTPALVTHTEFRTMQLQCEAKKICWVYFFWNEATDLYKIGKSIDPWRRCQELSSISGSKLYHQFSIQGPDLLEKIVHRNLSSYRHSHEWFKNHDVVSDLVETFEDYDIWTGVTNPVLSAEHVEKVFKVWADGPRVKEALYG